MTRADLMQLTSVRDELPFVFRNGKRWTSFDAHCGDCCAPIPAELLRGTVTTLPTVVAIDAWGLCQSCGRVGRFRYRLHDDMTMAGVRNGRWVRWGPARPTSWWLSRAVPIALLALALWIAFLFRVAGTHEHQRSSSAPSSNFSTTEPGSH